MEEITALTTVIVRVPASFFAIVSVYYAVRRIRTDSDPQAKSARNKAIALGLAMAEMAALAPYIAAGISHIVYEWLSQG